MILNIRCLKEFAVDEIEMHEREHCKKRVVECQLQCGLQVQEGDRNHHEVFQTITSF